MIFYAWTKNYFYTVITTHTCLAHAPIPCTCTDTQRSRPHHGATKCTSRVDRTGEIITMMPSSCGRLAVWWPWPADEVIRGGTICVFRSVVGVGRAIRYLYRSLLLGYFKNKRDVSTLLCLFVHPTRNENQYG